MQMVVQLSELLDDDNDGVINANDQCESSEGVEVDENGCEVDTELDTDNDGIRDDIDECPGTTEGSFRK